MCGGTDGPTEENSFFSNAFILRKFGTGYQVCAILVIVRKTIQGCHPSSKDNLNVRAGQIWIQGWC